MLNYVCLCHTTAMLREAARPDYWTPDDEITECHICNKAFDADNRLHHCRACGRGVCDECSPIRRPVPSHGWHSPVRICVSCSVKDEPL